MICVPTKFEVNPTNTASVVVPNQISIFNQVSMIVANVSRFFAEKWGTLKISGIVDTTSHVQYNGEAKERASRWKSKQCKHVKATTLLQAPPYGRHCSPITSMVRLVVCALLSHLAVTSKHIQNIRSTPIKCETPLRKKKVKLNKDATSEDKIIYQRREVSHSIPYYICYHLHVWTIPFSQIDGD